jgi:hypothetical protein
MTARIVVALALAASSVAHADPEPKSPRTALWLSLATSAAGLGLEFVSADAGIRPQAYGGNHNWVEPTACGVGAGALIVGPSLGRIYGDAPLWNKGTTWRLIGLGIAATGVGAALALGYSQRNSTSDGPVNTGPVVVGGAALAVGGGLYIAGASYEIATTPSAVERANHTRGFEAQLTLAPLRSRDGGVVPAAAIVGRF